MKSECHVTVAQLVAEIMYEKYAIKLDTDSFICGNVKPDHVISFFYLRHNIESTFGLVMENIRTLSLPLMTLNAPFNEYCFQLGMVCHHITDYFSLAHNSCFAGGLRKHILYERAQEKLTPLFIDSIKKEVLESQGHDCGSIQALSDAVIRRHKSYLSDTRRSIMSDFYYAVSMCCDVIASVYSMAYARRRNTETVPAF